MDSIILDFVREVIRQVITLVDYDDIWSFIYVFKLVLGFYFLNRIVETMSEILNELKKQNDKS